MAGKIGRSGRWTWDKEVQSKELWDLAIPVLKHALKSKNKALYDKKVEIALALVNKMLPQKVEGENFGDRYTFIGDQRVDPERMSRLVALTRERASQDKSV